MIFFKSEEVWHHSTWNVFRLDWLRRYFHFWLLANIITERTHQVQKIIQYDSYNKICKVGCVLPMVIWSELRARQFRDDDHPWDAPRLSSKRTSSDENWISTHHEVGLCPPTPNWCLKNLYDVIRVKYTSSSADCLHCKV